MCRGSAFKKRSKSHAQDSKNSRIAGQPDQRRSWRLYQLKAHRRGRAASSVRCPDTGYESPARKACRRRKNIAQQQTPRSKAQLLAAQVSRKPRRVLSVHAGKAVQHRPASYPHVRAKQPEWHWRSTNVQIREYRYDTKRSMADNGHLKPIFYDEKKRRWKRLRRTLDISAAVGLLLLISLRAGRTKRMRPLPQLLLDQPKRNFRALNNPANVPAEKARKVRSAHRRTDRKPSDVPLNADEGSARRVLRGRGIRPATAR